MDRGKEEKKFGWRNILNCWDGKRKGEVIFKLLTLI